MDMEWSKRSDTSGKFVRQREPWSPESGWNENGNISNKGRFMVYRPDYPRAYANGIALRSHVVWWLNTGSIVPRGWNIHHKNGDKLDDRFENLELLEHRLHSRIHNPKSEGVALECAHCGNEYRILPGRMRGRVRDGYPSRFCSQRCYHAHQKPKQRSIVTCEFCGDQFETIPSVARRRKYCSHACSARMRWKKHRQR